MNEQEQSEFEQKQERAAKTDRLRHTLVAAQEFLIADQYDLVVSTTERALAMARDLNGEVQ